MSDLKLCANTSGTGVVTLRSPDTNTDRTILLPDRDTTLGVTAAQEAVLGHLSYDASEDQIVSDVAIETTLNSLYLGGQHKMSSGAENVYFTNLSSKVNFYPAWGGLKDQSIAANQGASGYIAPRGRVFTNMFSLPLGGSPVSGTATGYDGDNYFGINISGLGITTVAAEAVDSTIKLQYRIAVNGVRVYSQTLPRVSSTRSTAGSSIAVGDVINWFFDHPVDIVAGTTLRATIMKIRISDDVELGVFQVQQGDTVDPNTNLLRYQATVSNRLFEDKDLEFATPYIKSQAMDFSLDATGSSILLKDLTLGTSGVLKSYPVNLLEASANGATIRIKIKGGTRVVIDSLPVTGASVSGTLVNSVLNQAVVALNSVFTNTASFLDANTFVSSFTLSGNNLTLGLNDGVSYTVDVTTLGVDENKFVSSGALSGTNLLLTMSDGSVVTIDATNMINGSALSVTTSGWFFSYGSQADQPVNNAQTNAAAGVAANAPFYWGEKLKRGSEFKFTRQYGNKHNAMGIWGHTQAAAGTVTSRQPDKWQTCFFWNGQAFLGSTNTELITANNTLSAYTPPHAAPLSIRFGSDGHLTLLDLSGGGEVIIAKTLNALAVTEFNMQWGSDQDTIFPNTIITSTDNLWEVVHDYANIEGGILNGILDHTVLKSVISIVPGEKIMFMLDEVGQGDYFGTDYTAASTGVLTAEEQLTNTFLYQTNEAIVISTASNTSDWTPNTSAAGYFFAANLHQYRAGGGSGTIQGMHSLRYNGNNDLEIWDEDTQERIATATAAADGSKVHLYFGVKGNRAYYSIPVVSKQTLGQSSQPVATYVPTVANQTVSITEAEVLNFQVVSSNNIVNQFVEVDAPSWMTMNQTSGVLSGTAPAYAGTAADTIVVNCKAGNAIGGHVSFTVTVTVAQVAYTNTKSLNFNGTSQSLQGNPLNITALDRATNGDGNAWSISMWVKPNASTSVQTLFVYGFGNDYSGGAVTLKQAGGTGLALTYGTVTNNILILGSGAFNSNAWNHILVTFDGGTTGSVAGDAAQYYSRFKFYANGVSLSTAGVATGSGFDAVLNGSNASDNIFRIGKASNTHNNYFGGIINQVGIWNSDQTANLSTIYNSGATQNLANLSAAPSHVYEMGTSLTTVSDSVGNADLTGYNFVSGDLVSDTP